MRRGGTFIMNDVEFVKKRVSELLDTTVHTPNPPYMTEMYRKLRESFIMFLSEMQMREKSPKTYTLKQLAFRILEHPNMSAELDKMIEFFDEHITKYYAMQEEDGLVDTIMMESVEDPESRVTFFDARGVPQVFLKKAVEKLQTSIIPTDRSEFPRYVRDAMQNMGHHLQMRTPKGSPGQSPGRTESSPRLRQDWNRIRTERRANNLRSHLAR